MVEGNLAPPLWAPPHTRLQLCGQLFSILLPSGWLRGRRACAGVVLHPFRRPHGAGMRVAGPW